MMNWQLHRMTVLGICFAVLATIFAVTNEAQAAEPRQSKIDIIVEPGVPQAFSDDIYKAVDYMERFYKEKYNITFKRDVRIVITPDKEAYTVARMREGGETRAKAERHAKFASGNSFDATNTIVLNGGHKLMASSTAKRVKTTIHELTHQVQAQLSNERQSEVGHMWLSEGSANSLAFRVMEYAGFSTVKQERIDWFKNVTNTAKKIPRPESLLTREEWLGWMDQKYNAYGVGTSMTEFLIDQCGGSVDGLIVYYKTLKKQDKDKSFQKAFGMTYEAFLTKYIEYYEKEILVARGEA